MDSRCRCCGHWWNWKEDFLQRPPCPKCGNPPAKSKKGEYNQKFGMTDLERIPSLEAEIRSLKQIIGEMERNAAELKIQNAKLRARIITVEEDFARSLGKII